MRDHLLSPARCHRDFVEGYLRRKIRSRGFTQPLVLPWSTTNRLAAEGGCPGRFANATSQNVYPIPTPASPRLEIRERSMCRRSPHQDTGAPLISTLNQTLVAALLSSNEDHPAWPPSTALSRWSVHLKRMRSKPCLRCSRCLHYSYCSHRLPSTFRSACLAQ